MLAVALGFGAGCTTTAGTAAPVPSPTASLIAELPPRPHEVRLDGVDPCSLLTEQQKIDLGINEPLDTYPPGPRGEIECEFQHTGTEPYYSYMIGVVTGEGVEAWLTGRRVVEIQTFTIAGFGVVETRIPGPNDFDCQLEIDVADGQTLDVAFVSSEDEYSEQDLCDEARVGAEAALATLLAR